MKNQLDIILKNKEGFTRVQNVMILVLALILTAVGIYAVWGYQKASYQVKADHTAERIFDIAEKFMKGQKSLGNLEDFNITASHYGGVVRLDKQEAILRSLYEKPDFDSFIARHKKKYREVPIYYLLLNSKASSGEERDGNPVLSMFEHQLLDENITKHTILIEYNGDTGEIFSVLYSEKADTLTYDGDKEANTNVIVRDKKSLNEKWQGYCGADLEDL